MKSANTEKVKRKAKRKKKERFCFGARLNTNPKFGEIIYRRVNFHLRKSQSFTHQQQNKKKSKKGEKPTR